MRSKWFLAAAVLFGINLGLGINAFAQGTPIPSSTAGWITVALSIVTMIWPSISPLATAWITGAVNKYKIHVPQPFQVVAVAVLGALMSGFSSGLDPVITGVATVGGVTSQLYAGASAKTLKTEPPL